MTAIELLDGRVAIVIERGERISLTNDEAWLVVALALASSHGVRARVIQRTLGVDIKTGALRKRIERLHAKTGLIITSQDLKADRVYHLSAAGITVDALRYLELVEEIRAGTGGEEAVAAARSLWKSGPVRFGKLPSPAPECYDRLAEAHRYLKDRGRRILIVDDQVGDLLAARLRRHECKVARSLEEFEKFRCELDSFDLAVVDLHLTHSYADATGDVIARDINSLGTGLPVVMITLRPPENRSVLEWIKSLGLVDVIFKAGDEPGADMAFVANRVNELLQEGPASRACDQLALKVQSLRRRARQRLRAGRTDREYEEAANVMDRDADRIARLAGKIQLAAARAEIERFIVTYGE